MTRILVSGCLGFIGSYFVKQMLTTRSDVSIVGINRLSNTRNRERLAGYKDHPNLTLHYLDFAKDDLADAFKDVDYVIHFGAKTFVDYSIRDPEPFVQSNIIGTYKMLEEARKNDIDCFVQVSTDEVYGSILEGAYKEDARPNPTNPYAATKMAADALVLAYQNCYGLKTIITRTENNYGPWQSREKVFPVFVRKALNDELLPVYGDGQHKRMWLHVEDHCKAIWHLLLKSETGIFHVAGEQELTNLELAKRILKLLNKPDSLIEFIPDHDIRPGHDRRYALDCSKLRATGWKPLWSIDKGFEHAVDWYKQNQWWFM